mmetsp:Transcript_156405/g.288439  ORF Transcript_156405/g.288439 Transcript_156405/m.288439 type:complete len:93 (-) Transcript_156405:50-328(-)
MVYIMSHPSMQMLRDEMGSEAATADAELVQTHNLGPLASAAGSVVATASWQELQAIWRGRAALQATTLPAFGWRQRPIRQVMPRGWAGELFL